MSGALTDFWQFRGYVLDCSRRLDRALASDNNPSPARAKALLGGCQFASLCGDPAVGRHRAEKALALDRALGDDYGTANANWALGYAVAEEGDWPRAQQLLEESVRGFRALGDQNFVLWT